MLSVYRVLDRDGEFGCLTCIAMFCDFKSFDCDLHSGSRIVFGTVANGRKERNSIRCRALQALRTELDALAPLRADDSPPAGFPSSVITQLTTHSLPPWSVALHHPSHEPLCHALPPTTRSSSELGRGSNLLPSPSSAKTTATSRGSRSRSESRCQSLDG